MLSRYADLEIVFRRRDERSYGLSFRYSSPNDEAVHPARTEPTIALDLSALGGDDPQAYSETLSRAFFTPEVKAEFLTFRDITQRSGLNLRVRLSIDLTVPELHGVHWETLRDPDLPAGQENAPLFMGEKTVVSRFLSSGDWRPVRLSARAKLRALVVVANPSTSSSYNLSEIDVPDETSRITEAMAGIEIVRFHTEGAVPLAKLAETLRQGFDILYLVCHGRMQGQEPFLYLDEGPATPGIDLVQAIREMDKRPRMVVLVS